MGTARVLVRYDEPIRHSESDILSSSFTSDSINDLEVAETRALEEWHQSFNTNGRCVVYVRRVCRGRYGNARDGFYGSYVRYDDRPAEP